jgi:hypothetical protein
VTEDKIQIIGLTEPQKDRPPLVIIGIIKLPEDHPSQGFPLAAKAADEGRIGPQAKIQIENSRHKRDQQEQAH